LHEVLQTSEVSEQTLLLEGLTTGELRAIRLLSMGVPAVSDAAYLARLAFIGRAAGRSGHLARLVKIADLRDRQRHPRRRGAGCASSRADVLITDSRMPTDHSDEGIRLAEELRDVDPHRGVVVLSQSDDPGYALALLDRGSDGRAYLLKHRVHNRAELTAAIR